MRVASQPETRQVSGKRSPSSGGTSSDSGSGEDSKRTNATTSTSSTPDGYAADWESLASKTLTFSRPPEELHFRNHHHHHHHNHNPQHHRSHHHAATADKTRSHPNPCLSDETVVAAKRQKMLEAQFAAHTAIKDVEAAGIPMPELRPDRPRAISFTTVDVSRVNFFFSSQLSNQVSDGSGSLIDAVRAKEQKSKQQGLSKTNTTPKSNDVKVEDNKRSIFMEDERVYKEMLQTTAAFYRSAKSMACFETESNTSSVSDTESDDANFAGSMRPITAASCCSDRIILAAPTRPESSLKVSSSATPKTETTQKSAAASKANSKSVSTSLHPSAMTMGDALNFSQHGRLVVASTAPFRVIFANAAVAGIHGRPCHEISGQTLSRLLVLTKTTSKFKASFGEERLMELRKYSADKSKSNEHVSCLMKISPIVSEVAPTGHSVPKACITHLCVDLIPQDNITSSGNMLAPPKVYQTESENLQQHRQVMG